MIPRPKLVIAYAFLFLITSGVGYVAVSFRDTPSDPWVLESLGVAVLASFALFAWRRHVEATRERAWTGAFSFANVVARRSEEDALRRAESAR